MDKQIILKDLDLKTLKSIAYDLIATIEDRQKKLQAVNQEIANRPAEVQETKNEKEDKREEGDKEVK
jgi:hypothetical protein